MVCTLYTSNTGVVPRFTLLGKKNAGLLTRQDVTLLKANLLEIRAQLLLSGGHFDSCEGLCGACVKHLDCDAELQACSNLGCQETLAEKAKSNEKQSAMLVISINERTKHRTMES